MKTYLYRASNLKYTITFLASNFWHPRKTVISCNLFIIIIIIIITIFIIIINLFRRGFSECTEVLATSLIPLETILPEIQVLLSLVLAVLFGLK